MLVENIFIIFSGQARQPLYHPHVNPLYIRTRVNITRIINHRVRPTRLDFNFLRMQKVLVTSGIYVEMTVRVAVWIVRTNNIEHSLKDTKSVRGREMWHLNVPALYSPHSLHPSPPQRLSVSKGPGVIDDYRRLGQRRRRPLQHNSGVLLPGSLAPGSCVKGRSIGIPRGFGRGRTARQELSMGYLKT